MEHTLQIQNNLFTLHPSGAIFWQDKSMLLIADVHLGKVTHFRKHGAAIPPHLAFKNLEKLTEVSNHFQPKTVCFLGDLFHSNLNTEWNDFAKWVDYTSSDIVLINGNHDIIPKYLFEEVGVSIYEEQVIDNFLLTHHPTEHETLFNFCGHIHPGVTLGGVGRQTIKLACFFKSENQLILPAFGTFTGKYLLTPTETDEIYVLVDGEVLKVS
ncbi:ligase-associated DNA damage response endonuclease PdeM [Jejudonia soesokkakensis]|uniref:Ligase-associated DNA damage response endonuclease PdeM n=1 Tax=Jejudonia soesokkakensis TaxID=1323432 RepID=A0ABW2MVS0_9FLAO